VVFTVSPQPLTATATGEHALIANGYTKAVLRAATGQLAAEDPAVAYFPAYELVTGAPFGYRHFAPNLRTVTADGVDFVLRHFLAAWEPAPQPPARTVRDPRPATGRDECEDALLDYYAP
jgi:hypothetical protein